MAYSPFRYPQSKHVRTQTPPAYSQYRSYKPVLLIEFGEKCVYCRLAVGMLPNDDYFGVDHYKPQSQAPELACVYSNLFLACNACNRRKSDYWPTPSQRKAGQYLPNPCDHQMADHIRFVGEEVTVRSRAGQLAVEYLLLNDSRTLEFRKMILDQVQTCRARRAEAEDSRRAMRLRLSRLPTTDRTDRKALEKELENEGTNIDRLNAILRRLGALE